MVNTNNDRINEDVDLREVVRAIWVKKFLIITVTMLFTLGSVFYALSLPNIYKSEITLAPAGETNGLSIPGQLGGLAALAGVNIGNKTGDKTAIALEILKSRDFIIRFIEENDLYVPIMAAEGWTRETDELVINNKIYDETTKEWIRKVKPPFKPKPSKLEAYEDFKEQFVVNQDKSTEMIKLSIEHYSPYLAKDWSAKLVRAINEEMRTRDLIEAERSIAYLNEQILKTSVSDVKVMLYSLIEEQTKTVMLANVREEYVFKTIDPALVAEKKSKPNRIVIVILAALLSFMLMSFVIAARFLSRRTK